MRDIHRRRILLAEDNSDDIAIFRRAARNGTYRIELKIVTDGEQALDFLYKRGKWVEAWTPDLLVLSINIPEVNGWKVLRRMREDPKIPTIPTVIWTLAKREEYDARAYEWGTCGIFTKVMDTKDQQRQLQTIFDYFFAANLYPRGTRTGSAEVV